MEWSKEKPILVAGAGISGTNALRLLLQAEDLELAAPFSAAGQPGFTQHVTVTKRDPDLLLVFRFQEGGAAE